MISSLITGIRKVKGSEIGREIVLAVVAGAVSWYVAEKLSQWKKNKNV